MQRNKQTTYSITPGFRGKFGSSWIVGCIKFQPIQINRSVAADSQQQGSRRSLLARNSASMQIAVILSSMLTLQSSTPHLPRLDSISADTVYNPESWTSNLQATLTNTNLFELPAGPVGFAAVAEYGKQGYNLRPDPLALTDYYFSWKDSDGSGSRSHAAIGGELRRS